jgi:2-oxoisovalerate dehydrogenase E1 component
MNAHPKPAPAAGALAPQDWRAVLKIAATSRALDDLEESTLLPQRKVLYQFSARGHELTQVLLGKHLTGARDGVGAYYRSRPCRSSRRWRPR